MANNIRNKFINFFCNHDHKHLSSSPLVPQNDPSLLFVNSGMVQFKECFLQRQLPEYKNITTFQKCIRAGGKHNDLENVGHTKRHHTFFEMLGNFSFGGYFKDKAIELAWNFLTKELCLDKKRLYITVYKDDNEAFNIWHKLTGFDSSKIIRISTSDNFWQMADTGPCGPCSEIFYDHGDHLKGQIPSDNADTGDRYVEIWNLVFMQYNRTQSGQMHKLATPCIDTGMGLERICAVLSGTDDNFKTSIFDPIIAESKKITGNCTNQIAHRVIADHLRSCAFLIADGIMPASTGKGYVLRRIIRRAVRYANTLGHEKPLLAKIFPVLESSMKSAYPELLRARDLILSTLDSEEESFHQTLKNGLAILEDKIKDLKNNTLLGNIAFLLYDTYGFPLDLTIDILKEKNIQLEKDGFEKEMQLQKARAKAAWSGSGQDVNPEELSLMFKKSGKTKFVGYDVQECEAKIIAILDENKNLVKSSTSKELQVILDKTPFYAESGGQEGDMGQIFCNEFVLQVNDTKKTPDGIFIHYCKQQTKKEVCVNTDVCTSVDIDRREDLKRNHSATHILHHVLRKNLGNHVVQKGSLVAKDKLRFDFSYQQALTDEQIDSIECQVNNMIWSCSMVKTELKNAQEAIKSGAMALFGEKYDQEVRVVSMGDAVELCGGTHVKNTSSIGLFKITAEGSIARGIRRIEALTHNAALQYIREQKEKYQNQIQELESKIKTEYKAKQQELLNLYKRLIKNTKPDLEQKIGSVLFCVKSFDGIAQDIIKRTLSENIEKQSARVFITHNSEKVFLNICISKDVGSLLDIKKVMESCKNAVSTNAAYTKECFGQIILKNNAQAKQCLDVIKDEIIALSS